MTKTGPGRPNDVIRTCVCCWGTASLPFSESSWQNRHDEALLSPTNIFYSPRFAVIRAHVLKLTYAQKKLNKMMHF